MKLVDLELSGLRLSDHGETVRRDRVGKGKHHDLAFDARYDWTTLFYDCFASPCETEILLIGPPLLNLQSMVEEAEYRVDDQRVPIKHVRNISRCSVVALDASPGRSLSVGHTHFGGRLAIGTSYSRMFRDLNCVYSISLNNRLEWIDDWIRYYVRCHGLEAVLLSDNGSTSYSPKDLREVLSSIPNLRQAAIIRARYPFGPVAENNSAYAALFLQRSMAEMARLRFFPEARAVLNADIDELFHSYSGQSIFDAAVSSPRGLVRADAEWVYAKEPGPNGFARHRDHTHVSASGRPKANRKWCIVPRGPMNGKQWLTHFIEDRREAVDPDFRLWHFRQVSTSWKFDRGVVEPELVPDQTLINAMRLGFAD